MHSVYGLKYLVDILKSLIYYNIFLYQYNIVNHNRDNGYVLSGLIAEDKTEIFCVNYRIYLTLSRYRH